MFAKYIWITQIYCNIRTNNEYTGDEWPKNCREIIIGILLCNVGWLDIVIDFEWNISLFDSLALYRSMQFQSPERNRPFQILQCNSFRFVSIKSAANSKLSISSKIAIAYSSTLENCIGFMVQTIVNSNWLQCKRQPTFEFTWQIYLLLLHKPHPMQIEFEFCFRTTNVLII